LKHLKKFSLKTVFDAADGIEDKIDLAVGSWRIIATKAAFFRFRHYLGAPPKGFHKLLKKDPANLGWETFPRHGRIFNRPQIKGKNAFRLTIRKTPLLRGTKIALLPPLCGGHLRFQQSSLADGTECRIAILHLSLNLLRYLRHQPKQLEPSDAEVMHSKTRFFRRAEDRHYFEGEWTCDVEDNWIPDTKNWRRFTTRKKADAHILEYVHTIRQRVESEIRRAVECVRTEGVEIQCERMAKTVSLSKVECAWEFKADDPNATACAIGGGGIQISRDNGEANLYHYLGKTGRLQNSMCFQAPLRSGQVLKVYGKTNKRVRLEIVQEDISNRLAALLRLQRIKMPKDLHSHLDYSKAEHLLTVLRVLRQSSAECLNAFVADLRRREFEQPASAIELLSRIATAIPQHYSAKRRMELTLHITSQLAHHLGIRTGKKHPGLGAVVSNLDGVLEYDPKRPFYRVTPQYILAAFALRSLDGERYASALGVEKMPRKYVRAGNLWFRDR